VLRDQTSRRARGSHINAVDRAESVCVGRSRTAAGSSFPYDDPIGQTIRWLHRGGVVGLRIIGVLEPTGLRRAAGRAWSRATRTWMSISRSPLARKV